MTSGEIGDLLTTVWRRWKSSSPVGSGEVTQEQYWILKSLTETGPVKVKDLASAIGCTPGSASVAVKRLEKSGMVSRERGGDDERVVKVSLSEKGSLALERWKADQRKSMATMFEDFDPEELATLQRLLNKALSHQAGLRLSSMAGGKRRA